VRSAVLVPVMNGEPRHATIDAMSVRMSMPVDETQAEPIGTEFAVEDKPWQTVVWNDPVNLMSYVTYVFQKLFGYSREHATKLMLDVHHRGKAIVSSGTKDKVEGDVAKLHAAGLWATMQHPS
jgi:ATP-dependent Clp protease adaptor protein ClpS